MADHRAISKTSASLDEGMGRPRLSKGAGDAQARSGGAAGAWDEVAPGFSPACAALPTMSGQVPGGATRSGGGGAKRFLLRWPGAISGLILALLAGGPGCTNKDTPVVAPTVTVQVAAAESEKIERKITADAVIYPLRQAALVPKINAPVRKFYVERGSHVRAGELLVQLENQDLLAAKTDSEGAYQQAQAVYETTTKQSLPEEIQKAELDAKAAKEVMEAAQSVYEGQQKLLQQGAVARKTVDDANVAYIQARNQYDVAQRHLESLEKLGTEQGMKSAQGQLASARGKLLGAQAQLSYAEIRSPMDGVVTDRPLYAGEMPAAGAPLITVMDLSRVVARAHIDQQQAAALQVGDAAEIAAPGIPESLPGKVTMVSPALDPGSTTVEVWVQAANPRERVRPGGSARLTIVAETVAKAVVIPAVAVLTAPDGGASVMVVGDQNKPQSRSVKLGIRDGDDVQVTTGLQAGEHVVTVGAYDLSKEDPEVLARTTVVVAAPAAPDADKGGGENKAEAGGGGDK